MTTDLVECDKAVRLARTQKASQLGRKRLSALTVQKFATFLDLDDPVVARLVTGAAGEDEPSTQV